MHFYFVKPENIEFIALFEASGWSQAHAAKRLWKDRASINRYLNGKIVPEQSVLELFKIILAGEKPGALSVNPMKEEALDFWEQKILNDLRPLQPADRERVLKTIRVMIEDLPQRPPVTYRLSSNREHKPSSGPKRIPIPAEMEKLNRAAHAEAAKRQKDSGVHRLTGFQETKKTGP